MSANLDLLLENPQPLQHLSRFIWQSLRAGATEPGHSWHSGCLTTCRPGDKLRVNSRTVILRQVSLEKLEIDCHTDVRSEKVEDIELNPRVGWMFYDDESKIQLRVWGDAQILNGAEADEAWSRTPLTSRSAYLSVATPGTLSQEDLPPSTDDRSTDMESSERGRTHFRIVRTRVHELELLYLKRGGHIRAVCRDVGDSSFKFHWMVP